MRCPYCDRDTAEEKSRKNTWHVCYACKRMWSHKELSRILMLRSLRSFQERKE